MEGLQTFIHVALRRGTFMTFCSCRNTRKKGKRTKAGFSPCLCCFMSKFQRGKADSFFFCQRSSFKRLLPAPSFIFPRCSYLGRRYHPGTSGREQVFFFCAFLFSFIYVNERSSFTGAVRITGTMKVASASPAAPASPIGLRHGRRDRRRL